MWTFLYLVVVAALAAFLYAMDWTPTFDAGTAQLECAKRVALAASGDAEARASADRFCARADEQLQAAKRNAKE